MFGATSIQAITVNYNLNATLAPAASSGSDPLHLAGSTVKITGTVDSVSGSANLSVTLGGLSLNLSGVGVHFSAGSPGSISISGNALGGIPFSASIQVNLTSSNAAPFPQQNIQGGTLTYGSPSTVISIASGTVVATSNAPSITASPASVSFTMAQGGVLPPSQSVTLSAPSTISFTAQANDPWVSVTPTSGQTGGTLTISLKSSSLPTTAGSHTSGITITSPDAANSGFVIPVNLTITSGNVLTPSPSSLSFVFQTGGTTPGSQSISVTSSGSPLAFTVSSTGSNGGNWLMVSPTSATTPATLRVSVNPSGLAPGTQSATITLTPATGSAVKIPVTFTVAAASSLVATPASLAFTSGLAGPVSSQTVALSSKTGTTGFTASASTTSGGNWLSVTSSGSATPANLTISADPSALAAGSYTGSVTVSSGTSSPLIIPVTLTVSAALGLIVTPSSLNFSAPTGSAGPGAQVLNVSGNGSSLDFTTSSSSTSGGAWFSVSPANGTAPTSVTVSVNLAGLQPGSYAGSITFTPSGGGNAVTVPLTLTVSAPPALVTGKSALAFAYEIGGTAPSPRAVTVGTSGSALTVNATGFTNMGGAWLTATPSIIVTPGDLSVSVNPANLAAGIYTGTVSLSAPGAVNGSSSIAVVLGVSADAAIVAAPNPLTFTAQAGGSSPAPQTVDLASTGAAVSVNVTASGGQWLSVSPASTNAPGNLTVSANSSGLAAGTYTGSISITYGGASPLTIPATLTVNPPAPAIQAVTDAASLASGALAPFSLFTIWGANLGPVKPVGFQLDSSGQIGTTLGDTQVLVNGTPAPLLMVSAGQVNAVMPGSVAPGTSVNVQVVHQSAQSNSFPVQVTAAAPALFTAQASGSGQGAILNEDSSANSASNPAEPGSVVVLFLDGAGLMTPLETDGSITTSVFDQIPKLNSPVSVQIGGAPAEIEYAGPAPGELAGLTQVNARVPAGTVAGAVPVTVTVGTATSQSGVTLAVK